MNKSLWQRAQPHAIAIGIFFIVSVIYCLPSFQGLVVAQHDVISWKGMAQQSLEFHDKYGRYPLWTNAIFSGMPAFQIAMGPTINITLAHLHHLFTAFLPDPAGLFFLACLGFYVLCISLRMNIIVAVMGSLAYAYASYSAIIVAVGHIPKFASMGYAPAVLAGLVLLSQRKYLLGFLTTLVFGTNLFYQNHIQIVYYTLLIAVLFAIVYFIQIVRTKEWKHLLKAGALALTAGLMSMLAFSIGLVPTYDYSKETMRGGRSELSQPGQQNNKSKGGLDKDYAFAYSYGITEVLTIAAPRLYGGSSDEMQPGSKTAAAFAEKTGMSEEQADGYAQSLPAYWGPQGGTSGAVYFGAFICILFIVGLTCYKDWHVQWILAASILGIFLAWGKNFGALNYFLFDHLPFYNKFRAPSMALVIPQLTFPLLASLGLNEIFEKSTDKKLLWKNLKLASIISGIFLALLVFLYFSLDYKGESDANIRTQLSANMVQQMSQRGKPTPEMQAQADEFGRAVTNALKEDRRSLYGSDLVRSLIFIALGAAVLFGFLKGKITKNIAAGAIAVIVFIDLIGVDLRYLNSKSYIEKDDYDQAFTPTKADLEIKKDTSYYRVFNSEPGGFESTPTTTRTSYLHNSVGGYHPAKLALYNDLITHQLERGNLQVFNMLNTKYFIVTNPANRQPEVQRNPDALGPVWFVKAIKFVSNADEEMNALDDFHPRDTAVADKREQSKITTAFTFDSSATIRLEQNVNDYIKYQSSSRNNEFAVFSEVYYPNGWTAYIDEKETPIVKVNYLLRGLSVPAGQHTIEFRFAPIAYTIGNDISLITGIASILILAWGIFTLWKDFKKENEGTMKKQVR